MTSPAQYFIGLALAQAGAFTALAVLEQTASPVPASYPRAWPWHYAVRHLERFPIGTPYSAILEWLATHTREPPLRRARLVVDQTGVGRPVVRAFRRAGLAVGWQPVIVTAGPAQDWQEGVLCAPKVEVATALQLALQERRLQIAQSLPHAATLGAELRAFRPKVRTVTDGTVADWRERPHDDLVFAVGLPLWLGEGMRRLTAESLGC